MGDVITNFKVKNSGHTDYNGNDYYYEVIRSKETDEELTVIYAGKGIIINGFDGYSSLTCCKRRWIRRNDLQRI